MSDQREVRPVRVFISYRRDDAEGYAGRLYDSLGQHFGPENLFMDVDSIGPGEDFTEKINQTLLTCDVFLALIGRQWLTVTGDNGRRRLSNPRDWVRLEVQSALEHGIRVIPVLLQGASMPAQDQLPRRLAPLARRNAFEIGPRWHSDVEQLVLTIKESRERAPAPPPLVDAASTTGQGTAAPPAPPVTATPAPHPKPARGRPSVRPLDVLALLAVCASVASLLGGLLQSGLTLLYVSLAMGVLSGLLISAARVRHLPS